MLGYNVNSMPLNSRIGIFIQLSKTDIMNFKKFITCVIVSLIVTNLYPQCIWPSGVECTENPANQFTVITETKTFSQMIGNEILDPSQSPLQAQFLVVCETIQADLNNYIFAEGSEIVFLNNQSTLEVLSGAILEFRNSYLHGCEKLWDRILVHGGGQLEITNGCRIEDAVVAVRLDPYSTFLSTSSTLDGNYVAIQAGADGNPIQYAVTLSITGTTIAGSKDLLETYGSFPCTYEKPRYGFLAGNLQLVVHPGNTRLFRHRFFLSDQGGGS